MSDRPGHLMDIMATCIEVSGVNYPSWYNGNEIPGLEGESLVQSIKNASDERESVIFLGT